MFIFIFIFIIYYIYIVLHIMLFRGQQIIKREILTQVFSCEFCEISKNTFSYRTPPVAVSVLCCYLLKGIQERKKLNLSFRAGVVRLDYHQSYFRNF